MPVIDHRHYVPILKGKKGEFDALLDLQGDVKERMTPMIELMTFTDDEEDNAQDGSQKISKKKLDRSLKSLAESWGKEHSIFIDFFSLSPEQTLRDSNHPVEYVFNELRSKGVRSIPTCGISRDEKYREVIKQIIQKDGRGVCLRVDRDDFNTPNWATGLESAMKDLDVIPSDVDLVMDISDIVPKQEGMVELFVSTLLNNFPRIADWRSLILAATAFPESLSVMEGFSSHQMTITPRTEWIVWKALLKKIGSLSRMPTFGDYAIAHPNIVDFDPRFMKMSANIRYTLEDDWLIVKGGSLSKGKGYEQYHDLAELLVASDKYKFEGPNYSSGDHYIAECAKRSTGPGSATVWRKVGTNHHLTFVVRQIAKQLAS